VFYVTPTTFSEARTFRLPLVEVSQDLLHDDQEPEDIPVDLQHDLLVYGTAIELQNEEPEDIPEIWMARFEAAKSSMLVFAKAQAKDQTARYGEAYYNRVVADYRRNHV
jgi:hypothetical protein